MGALTESDSQKLVWGESLLQRRSGTKSFIHVPHGLARPGYAWKRELNRDSDGNYDGNRRILCTNCVPEAARRMDKSFRIWYAREDSNLWPFAPEANALSRLSYGRTKATLFQEPLRAIATREECELCREAELLPPPSSSSMCCRSASSFISLSHSGLSSAGV